jgi:predicted secreted protein
MTRRRAILLATAAVWASIGVGGLAWADGEPGVRQAGNDTLLHLSASRSVQVTPDELAADLVAQSSSSSPAEAQRQVNGQMADGMRAAQAVSQVKAQAVGYSVVPTDEKRTNWTAQQTLALSGTDGAAVLGLTNRLQTMGFVTAALDWRLSPALERKAHDEATTEALKALQARAAATAATLGLHVDHMQDLRLDGPSVQPFAAMQMRAAVSGAVQPPQASAAEQTVTAQVQAEVVLRP